MRNGTRAWRRRAPFHRGGVVAILAATCMLAGGTAARAAPVLEFGSGTNDYCASACSAGWSFTTTRAISVVALDAWDPTGTGNVRLYDGTGTVLASATVTTSDPVEGSPFSFYSHAIIPVSLLSGTTYYIVEDIAAGTTRLYDFATTPTVASAITYGGGVLALASGSNPTTGGSANAGYFGPNFDIAVPEPSSFAVLTAGLFGFGAIRRRHVPHPSEV